MPFYEQGAASGGFEGGVRSALEAVLASPHFVFRMERERPATAAQGSTRVADLDLASRLSFFLWGAPPDEELLALAKAGKLQGAALEAQARRMLADPRADGARHPLRRPVAAPAGPRQGPSRSQLLPELRREHRRRHEAGDGDLLQRPGRSATRSLLDLYTADYTFVNERLARHYGFQGVIGTQFRRVAYPDATRRGILGQGSMLVQTSLANRTSPVLRGKWVMEVLLGTPPPPPPPNIPALEEVGEAKDGKLLTTRERMEMHRANPTCNACHRFMDPIGLSLDSFDVTGRMRIRENGMPLDTRGDYYDGSPINDLSQLTAALMKRPEPLVRTFTENLMAYALGRRIENYDQPAVRAIAKQGGADGYRMSAFILGVVKSDAFQRKRSEPPATTDAGPVADRR